MDDLVEKGYIPLDKSWHIRVAVIDLLKGYDDSIKFFEKFKREHPERFGTDLEDALQASLNWNTTNHIKLESGLLYRCLWYASGKIGLGKEFEKQRTLMGRDIGDTPDKLTMTLEELAMFDTSQWATAYALAHYARTGNNMVIPTDKYHHKMTFDAISRWDARKHETIYEPKYDETILAQAQAYLHWLKTGKMEFTPIQPEDYCFARAFGLMTPEEARKKWRNLEKHESNRIEQMEDQLQRTVITSNDHRVVQAIAMLKGKNVKFVYPHSVNKSWPEFWEFFNYASSL